MQLSKIFFSFVFVVIALSFQGTQAQDKYVWKQATSGGYTYKYVSNDPMQARFYTLANGLTVILSPNHKEPRVSVRIAVRAGSNTDPRNHTGLAHYLEHLLFKGTEQYGSLDWAKEKPYLDQIDALYEEYNSTRDTVRRKVIYHRIDSVSGLASKYAIANEYEARGGVMVMNEVGGSDEELRRFDWCETPDPSDKRCVLGAGG